MEDPAEAREKKVRRRYQSSSDHIQAIEGGTTRVISLWAAEISWVDLHSRTPAVESTSDH